MNDARDVRRSSIGIFFCCRRGRSTSGDRLLSRRTFELVYLRQRDEHLAATGAIPETDRTTAEGEAAESAVTVQDVTSMPELPHAAEYRKYLEPKTLARISALDLRARLIVEGLMTGMHRSPYQGISVEFAQHRPYVAGDDIRHVDWKVFGRPTRSTSSNTSRRPTST